MTGEIKYLGEWAKHTFNYAIIGILVGIAIVCFFLSLDLLSSLFLEFLTGYSPPSPVNEPHFFSFRPLFGNALSDCGWLLILLALIPALGGLISGLIKYKLLRVEKPELHETDVFIDAFHNEKGLIKGRDGLVRGVCSVLTLSSGGSA
ncbi:MAG: hypothetical protein J7J01_07715, partial [Methanophagales archaeon]|nr:hypothetical protein [Methanophagales archaeon]